MTEFADYDWMGSLEAELQQKEVLKKKGSNHDDTFDILAMHLRIMDSLKDDRVVDTFFQAFIQCLLNPQRKSNETHANTGLRPCEMWERFAEYYLRYVNINQVPDFNYLNVRHVGEPDDRGVDVFCDTRTVIQDYVKSVPITAVQAKRGLFFEQGKGNDVVLRLVGSLHHFNLRKGIIFSSEDSSKVKFAARDIIEKASKHPTFPVDIIILGVNNIVANVNANVPLQRSLMVRFIRDFFPTTLEL